MTNYCNKRLFNQHFCLARFGPNILGTLENDLQRLYSALSPSPRFVCLSYLVTYHIDMSKL